MQFKKIKYYYIEKTSNYLKKGQVNEFGSVGFENGTYINFLDSADSFKYLIENDNIRAATKEEINFFKLCRKLNEI